MSDVTKILREIRDGKQQSAEQLLSLVYTELKRIAVQKMAGETPGNTLQPTALVHEAWIKMVGDDDPHFENRAHFFSAAAEMMRRILVDSAREELREEHWVELGPSDELLVVDEALNILAKEDPSAANLVKLRYFVGMSMNEAATTMGMSLRSTEALWTFARAWLRRQIERQHSIPERV